MKRSAILTAAVMAIAFSATANAQLVLAPTGNMTNSINQGCGSQFTGGPVNLGGGVTYTSSNSFSVTCYTGTYGLNTNGYWTGSTPFSGLNTSSGWMRFTFANAVAAVGGYSNWAPGTSADVFIQTLDASNNVIDSYSIASIITPGGVDASQFRGISHNVNDIYSLQYSDGYVVSKDMVYGTVTATPEPASLLLMVTGLGGVVGFVRRRRKV
jgi:hypothetical protein